MGGGGDVAFDGEVGEEGFDFRFSHIFKMAFVVKEYEAADPLNVAFFGAIGVVFNSEGVADLVKEFFWVGLWVLWICWI